MAFHVCRYQSRELRPSSAAVGAIFAGNFSVIIPKKQMNVDGNKWRSRQGDVYFLLYEDSMKQQRLIQFMDRLVRTSKEKVFLILDNLKVHLNSRESFHKSMKKAAGISYWPPFLFIASSRNFKEFSVVFRPPLCYNTS